MVQGLRVESVGFGVEVEGFSIFRARGEGSSVYTLWQFADTGPDKLALAMLSYSPDNFCRRR